MKGQGMSKERINRFEYFMGQALASPLGQERTTIENDEWGWKLTEEQIAERAFDIAQAMETEAWGWATILASDKVVWRRVKRPQYAKRWP